MQDVDDFPPELNDAYGKLWERVAVGRSAFDILGKGQNSCVKINPNRPAPTLPKMQTGRGFATICHWKERRALTITEAKLLHGYPIDFQFTGTYSERWARIGNSVPPPLTQSIANHIRRNILKQEEFKVISTFSGCGGSSLGYQMAGGKILLAVEWDKNAVETYHLNFPDTSIYHGDIAELSVEKVLEITGLKPGDLDILDGSPPCQGFSTAGKREFSDDRNQLFREYVRLLRGLQPKVFVMENVSGMVKGVMKIIFAEILRELKASGYKVHARLLNAKFFNVPQSRERMIFIGVREDLGIEPSHPVGNSKVITVREALRGLSLSVQDEAMNHVWVDEVTRKTKWISRAGELKPGEKLIQSLPSATRAKWDDVCPTITKSSMPGQPPYVRNSTVHPSEPRTFSIREKARCHSFPDSFLFVGALNNGMQRIGNSVPPNFMRAIAEHVRDHILSARTKNRVTRT